MNLKRCKPVQRALKPTKKIDNSKPPGMVKQEHLPHPGKIFHLNNHLYFAFKATQVQRNIKVTQDKFSLTDQCKLIA